MKHINIIPKSAKLITAYSRSEPYRAAFSIYRDDEHFYLHTEGDPESVFGTGSQHGLIGRRPGDEILCGTKEEIRDYLDELIPDWDMLDGYARIDGELRETHPYHDLRNA